MLMTTGSTVFQATGGGFSVAAAADIALIVMAVSGTVLAVLGVVLFLRVNAILRDVHRTANRSLGPVSDRARAISDNVEFITQALRTDVERLNASVRSLSDRLQLASEKMEERIEEFNALMEVVQGEAEDVFLDTASTVRGVREGARAISERAYARPPRERQGAAADTAGSRNRDPEDPGPSGEN